MQDQVTIYTDGSCLGNPGPGGCAAILKFQNGDHERILSFGYHRTTNNRMELLAAIHALNLLPPSTPVTLFTDSRYLQHGMQRWLAQWKVKNWLGANRQQVKNQDLWKRLDRLVQQLGVITWCWVKGHSGEIENERCDRLALAAAALPLCVDEGYQEEVH